MGNIVQPRIMPLYGSPVTPGCFLHPSHCSTQHFKWGNTAPGSHPCPGGRSSPGRAWDSEPAWGWRASLDTHAREQEPARGHRCLASASCISGGGAVRGPDSRTPGLALLRPDPPRAQSVPLGNSSINSLHVGVLGQPFMISSSHEPPTPLHAIHECDPPGLAGSPLCPVPSLCSFPPSPSPFPECLQDLGRYVLVLLNGPLELEAAAFMSYSK